MTERSDWHRIPGMLLRPDPARRTAAEDALTRRGWTMNEFVEACLARVAANPVTMLRSLGPFRRSRPRGRPKGTGD